MSLIKIHYNIRKWKESGPFYLFEFSYFCYESARASRYNKCEGSRKCEKNYVDLICRLLQNDVNDAIFGCGKSHNKKWHVFE